jgi:hypothetical protein
MKERDDALSKCDAIISTSSVAMKDAVQKARVEERQHYSKLNERFKGKYSDLSTKMNDLVDRTISAEAKHRAAIKQVNLSTKRSRDVTIYVDALQKDVGMLQQKLAMEQDMNNDLQEEIQECKKQLDLANAAVPVKEICKVSDGSRGKTWPLFMWELIIEQIVNGTPPSSVNSNIVSMLQTFSPSTKISELPSIWTIRRARTVLLVIVQTLASYRIAKANKWEQLFTDGTSRRQVSFQDLIISIEEDELFKYVH